ncbi:sterol desaturase/sphingolipid hydroxylase (fatty acid hydroxylase superfamily) [Sphingopyxis panaciterrae]|nr:sterol desaturase/sphingolipid hydroxylase (fatty acid hydroxylase superfamily) [Sphingopyxis panaciterrae]
MMSPLAFALSWAVLLPFIAWTGWGAVSPPVGLGLMAAGLAGWTLFEYVMHRFLFHLEPRHPMLKWFVFLIHGNHHDNPGDGMRNMMPLSVSVPVAALVWSGCVACLGQPGTWAFLGWIMGYVIYDGVHYACHQRPMTGRIGAALKRHHMRHHYIDDTANYAISAIFWDRVFGTHIRSLKRR